MFLLKRCLCAWMMLGATAFAQESRGTIGGRVTDAHDAGIPGVKVMVTNLDTAVAVSLVTNDKGAYAAPLLIPGNYSVAAEREGFKKASNVVTLSVHDALQVDLRLEVGSVSESITVTESAPVLESSNGSVGLLLGNKEMTELPVAHGNPYQLIA